MITVRQVVLHQRPSLMARQHFLGGGRCLFVFFFLFSDGGAGVFLLTAGCFFCADDRWRRVCRPISHAAQERSCRAASAAVDCEQPRGRM